MSNQREWYIVIFIYIEIELLSKSNLRLLVSEWKSSTRDVIDENGTFHSHSITDRRVVRLTQGWYKFPRQASDRVRRPARIRAYFIRCLQKTLTESSSFQAGWREEGEAISYGQFLRVRTQFATELIIPPSPFQSDFIRHPDKTVRRSKFFYRAIHVWLKWSKCIRSHLRPSNRSTNRIYYQFAIYSLKQIYIKQLLKLSKRCTNFLNINISSSI